MTAFADAIGNAAKTGLCTFYRTSENSVSFLNRLLPGTDIPNLGRFFRSRLCDDPGDIPTLPLPFQGGQCPVVYSVGYTRTLYPSSTPCTPFVGNFSTNVLGPISGPITSNPPNPNPALRTDKVALINGNGTEVVLINSGVAASCPQSFVTINSVVRIDGQPDNCGNQPIDIPPYPTEGVTFVENTSYTDINNNTVNISPSFTLFAPVLIAPLTVIAPVRVDLPDFSFDGYFTLSPEFEFNFGRPPNAPNDRGNSSEGGEPDCPDCDPVTPQDDSDRKLIGMKVVANPTGNTRNTIIPQSGGPTLYLPRVANAFFRVRNRSGLSWFGPIAVQTRNAYVPVPENVDAIFGTVDFDTGWSGVNTQVFEGLDP